MTVGNNIRKARGNTKQADLAEELDVDISTISRWENDKNLPSSKMLQKIAEALKVSTEFLLSGNENDKNAQENANNLHIKKEKTSPSFHIQQNSNVLFLKDGEHEVSVPNTEENRHEFWKIVKQIFNKTSQIGLSIRDGQKNQYSVGDITLQNQN